MSEVWTKSDFLCWESEKTLEEKKIHHSIPGIDEYEPEMQRLHEMESTTPEYNHLNAADSKSWSPDKSRIIYLSHWSMCRLGRLHMKTNQQLLQCKTSGNFHQGQCHEMCLPAKIDLLRWVIVTASSWTSRASPIHTDLRRICPRKAKCTGRRARRSWNQTRYCLSNSLGLWGSVGFLQSAPN